MDRSLQRTGRSIPVQLRREDPVFVTAILPTAEQSHFLCPGSAATTELQQQWVLVPSAASAVRCTGTVPAIPPASCTSASSAAGGRTRGAPAAEAQSFRRRRAGEPLGHQCGRWGGLWCWLGCRVGHCQCHLLDLDTCGSYTHWLYVALNRVRFMWTFIVTFVTYWAYVFMRQSIGMTVLVDLRIMNEPEY